MFRPARSTGGAWIFYFADAPSLFVDLFTGQAHPVAYVTVAVLTATTFVLGGFNTRQTSWPEIRRLLPFGLIGAALGVYALLKFPPTPITVTPAI